VVDVGTKETGVTRAAPARPRVLVDSREQRPWVFSPAVDVEFGVSLPTSDYSLAGATDICAIERKSIADLVMSCASKERERFWECMKRLALYKHKALIVEGAMSDILAGAYRSQASPQSVIATTLAMQIDLGVGVVWAGDRTEAAKCCEWMLVRVHKRMLLEATDLARVQGLQTAREDRKARQWGIQEKQK
jgi:ERCC4-type nuclease